MNKKYLILGVFFVLLFASLSFLGFEQVNAGHRGIKLVWGKVVSNSLPEGLYFYNPISTNIVTMDTRLQKKTTHLETYTKDIQQTTMYITVNYFVDPQNAHILYQRIGLNYSSTLIEPALMSAVKDVVGKVEADKFINRVYQNSHNGDIKNGEAFHVHVMEESILLKCQLFTDSYTDLMKSQLKCQQAVLYTLTK